MKLFPILTAVLVCVALYFVVLDRETLVDFASGFGPEDAETDDQGDVSTEAVADASEAEADEDDGRVHVTARRSTAEMTENVVVLRGRTEAMRQVNVSAETSGRIVSEPLRAGAFVEEGQLMCEIAPGTREADLTEAQARLSEARARLPEAMARLPEAEARVAEARAGMVAAQMDATAATRLSESGFASETRAANADATLASAAAAIQAAQAGMETAAAGIETAESAILSAEAAVMRAQDELDKLQILAPFSGLLETDTAELGALMAPGALCGTIIELDPIKLVGFVPEAQVDRIEVGAEAGARLSSGRDVAGEVTFLSRSADPQTRTFRVEILVQNDDLSIRDGQTADILVTTAGTATHLLPASAMTLNDDGTLGVRIVEDGVARFVPVQMIRDTARGVLLAGLPDQVDVITVGQEFVTDGVPVRVTYEELTQ
ncbi:MAG: efflux RND transporter periplasmic adaptor subunit [Pseudomonadota bacterium]